MTMLWYPHLLFLNSDEDGDDEYDDFVSTGRSIGANLMKVLCLIATHAERRLIA